MTRLNVGCGAYLLKGDWVNLDADPGLPADIHATVPPIPFGDGELDEVYAGHFLEHLYPQEATDFLSECYRCLRPGGKLGIVVPDTREIVGAYLTGQFAVMEHPAGKFWPLRDLDNVCHCFLYGDAQVSSHRWSYDLKSLRRKIEAGGFHVTAQIDRWNDPRLGAPAWFQCGVDAVRPE